MANFSSLINKFTYDMQQMVNRVQYIENKMEECTEKVNDLVDVYAEQRDDTLWIKVKLADLEDCSYRNNIKIRGVPETAPPSEIQAYTSNLFSALIPELTPIAYIGSLNHGTLRTLSPETSL